VSPPESPIFVVRDVNGFLHSYSGSRVQLKSKTSVTFKHKAPLHFTQFQKYSKCPVSDNGSFAVGDGSTSAADDSFRRTITENAV
jgi:hypothetical protein